MKKLFILALIAIATGTSAFAGPSSKSTKVSEHFAASFSAAKNVSWTKNDDFDKATFELNNETVNVFYDKFGNLIATSKIMAFDKLPKAALETITTKYTYPEFQLKECIEMVNDTKEKNYYVSLDKEDETVVLEINKNGVVKVFDRITKN